MDWSGCLQVEQVPGKVSGAPILKDTRMPADAVIENYESGLPPAVIARYFSLDLRQVEAVIRYYLAHRPDAGVLRRLSSRWTEHRNRNH
jgi:uncharacterized protein (DUF433 family)